MINECLLCIISKCGNRLPSQLSSVIHATRFRQILLFDCLYLGASAGIERYDIVLKNGLSSYRWLEQIASADVENAAAYLSRCSRAFTAPSFWISEQGPHFINESLNTLANELYISHNHTLTYSFLANRTAEYLMETLLAAFRSLISESKLAPQD